MKIAFLVIMLLSFSLPVQAADPAVLNGYWLENSVSAKIIKYPYIWQWFGGSDFYSHIELSKMHLLKSDGKEFVFLYETLAISYENGQYFTRPTKENNISEPYRLLRFTLQRDHRGRDFFIEEDCYDKKLEKRSGVSLLNDKDLKDIWASAKCRLDSKEWSADWDSYTRLGCDYINQYPPFFRIIAPEYLPCQHTKKYKSFKTSEDKE